ncbi:MAG: DNA polymerase III subunit beta [Thermodesulfobacteriota bacterium]|nr:DNA polymerase III subunit beta [Thermodesulfobacteriota bacterium]
MKIGIKKSVFQKMISKVSGFTEKKSTLPILSHILIETYDEGIKVKATDLHISIQVKAECNVMEKGACALSIRNLVDMIRELPDTELRMQTEEGTRAKITVGDYKFNLNIMDPEEYPMLELTDSVSEGKDGSSPWRIDPLIVKSMIDQTLFSVATPSEEDSRYTLGGAQLVPRLDEKEGVNYIEMVTTDGRRLSMAGQVIPEGIDMENGLIIPRKGLQELRRLIDTAYSAPIAEDVIKEAGGPLPQADILLTKDSIFFKSFDTLATVRLIDGKFPDYAGVVDLEGYSFYTRMHASELLNALKVCSAIVSDVSNSVKFQFKGDTTIIYANNPEQGDVKIPIESEQHGSDIEVNFNPKYLIDCLSMIEGDVIIRLIDEEGPCLITPYSPEAKTDSKWIIMPMRF